MKSSLPICAALLLCGLSQSRAAEPAPLQRIAPAELQSRIAAKDDDVLILDVRTPAEFAAGHVPGARNIPHDQVAARLPELAAARDKQVVLYCRSGRRSALAAETLRAAGFEHLLQLEGDFPGWDAADRPVERDAAPEQAPAD